MIGHTMNYLVENILLHYKTLWHRRMRNRKDIEHFLRQNKGNGKIFGLYKKLSLSMLVVSVSEIGVKDDKAFVIFHSFDDSGTFVSNIQIYLDDIDSICPFDNRGSKVFDLNDFLSKYFYPQLSAAA